jgi:hypothetical protein
VESLGASSETISPNPSNGDLAAQAAANIDPQTAAQPQTQAALPLGERTAVVAGSPVLRVLGAGGRPLAGALVSVQDIDGEILGSFPSARSNRYLAQAATRTRLLREREVQRVSNAAGEVELPADVVGGPTRVLWVTALGYRAQAVVSAEQSWPQPLGASLAQGSAAGTGSAGQSAASGVGAAAQPAWPSEIQLQGSPAAEVLVLDPEGAPVAGAMVIAQALVDFREPVDAQSLVTRARRALLREQVTGADGRVRVPDLGSPQRLWAEHGERLSLPVEPGASKAVELTLQEPQPVEGLVRTRPGFRLGEWALLMVTRELADGRQEPLHADWVREGPLTPFVLPRLGDGERYRFEIAEGGNRCVPLVRDLPPAGTTLFVEFELGPGILMAAKVTDPDEKPLEHAEVRLVSLVQGIESESRSAHTDAAGVVYFPGHEPGAPYRLEGRKSGYAVYRSPEIRCSVEQAESGAWLVLTPQSAVLGRVVQNGLPVEDFDLEYWPSGSVQLSETLSVRQALDGRFRLDGAPLGPLVLVAQQPGRALGRPVELPAERPADFEVELEIPLGRSGYGQVVDLASGRPLEGVQVELRQPLENAHRGRMGLAGIATTGADGRYRLSGLWGEQPMVLLSAPGYRAAVVMAEPDQNGEYRFSEARLQPVAPLTIQLVTAEDPTQYSATVVGHGSWERLQFDAQGRVELDFARGVPHGLHLFHPDGVMDVMQWTTSGTGPWSLRWHLRPETRLVVRTVGADGDLALTDCHATLDYVDEEGQSLRRLLTLSPVAPNHESAGIPSTKIEAKWNWLPAGAPPSVPVQQSAGAFDLLITEGLQRLDLPVELGNWSLRIVDGTGQPMEGVYLVGGTNLPPEPLLGLGHSASDGDGLVQLPVASSGQLWIGLLGPKGEVRADIVLKASDFGAQAVPVVLDARHVLEARLVNGLGPKAEVGCYFYMGMGQLHFDTRSTDGTGLLKRPGFAEGSYQIYLYAPEHYNRWVDWSAGKDASSPTWFLPRATTLRLELLDASGAALANTRVRFQNLTISEGMPEFVRAGLCASEALQTDNAGRLQLAGLPEGRYRLLEPSPAGGPLEFDLNPDIPNTIRLVLP